MLCPLFASLPRNVATPSLRGFWFRENGRMNISETNRSTGPGNWTFGAFEIERFEEDLHLRILASAEAIKRLMDDQAETAHRALAEAPTRDNLSEWHAEDLMATASEAIESTRFAYNWADVILTSRVVDAIKNWYSSLVAITAPFAEWTLPRTKKCSEVQKFALDFERRFNIRFSCCPIGDSFLHGMVLARNKIVHNGAAVREVSRPDYIPVAEDLPGTFGTGLGRQMPAELDPDDDFRQACPEYVDTLDRVTVTIDLFDNNVQRSLAFIRWLGEQVDLFVLLSDARPGSVPS